MDKLCDLEAIDIEDFDELMHLVGILTALIHRAQGIVTVKLEELERIDKMELQLFCDVNEDGSFNYYALPQVGLKS